MRSTDREKEKEFKEVVPLRAAKTAMISTDSETETARFEYKTRWMRGGDGGECVGFVTLGGVGGVDLLHEGGGRIKCYARLNLIRGYE